MTATRKPPRCAARASMPRRCAGRWGRLAAVAALLAAPGLVAQGATTPGGQDLKLSYRSAIDGTDQPYRVFVPDAYRDDRPSPLVIALHQTGADEHSLFEDVRNYPQEKGLRQAAAKFGVLVVSPYGRGTTEFRGIGENDVWCVLAEVKRRFRVDEDRIYLTGHSMGGTGSAYIALHRPDYFAAVAPLAAAYGIPWIAANAGHVPFWWIGGELDRDFYKQGVGLGVERMRRLGCPVRFTELPGENHYGVARDFDPVLEWLLQHRRVAHPRAFTFEVDTPLHPRAYWITVETIARPGRVATVRARADSDRAATLELDNVSAVAFWPEPEIFSARDAIVLRIGQQPVFEGRLTPAQEVLLTQGAAGWSTTVRARREISLTAYRNHPIAFAPEALDMQGPEARLANWITDAMRAETGADIALYSRRSYRGLPLPAGTVDLVDLLQCSRPFYQELLTVRLTGAALLDILEANIQDRAEESGRGLASNLLVQASGLRYSFDRRLPAGQRIVSSTIAPERTYTVALEAQVIHRETIQLAGRFGKLPYETTGVPLPLALYGHAAREKAIRAPREGRVVEVR